MTREELDFIGSMNMCDEISNEAYKKIVCHCREQEPCEDAISRQAAIESIKNLYPDMPIVDIMGSRQKWLNKYAPYFECENAVEQLPPVNPLSKDYNTIYYTPQPKTGHWIGIDEEPHEDYECDKCGYVIWADENIEKFHYCPNCGARMIEPQESEEV